MKKKYSIGIIVGGILFSLLFCIASAEETSVSTISGRQLYNSNNVKIYHVSSMYRVYPEDRISGENLGMPIINLCRGEYEPFQVVVHPKVDLAQIQISPTKIPDGINVTCKPVGLVNIKKSNVRKGRTPDPLLNRPIINIPKEENTAIWVTVFASREVSAGNYSFNLDINAKGEKLAVIPVKVRIWDFLMPRQPHLAAIFEYRPDPWNYPWWTNYYPGFKKWPIDRKIKLHKMYYKFYAEHRIQAGKLLPYPKLSKNAEGEWSLDITECEEMHRYCIEKLPGVFQVIYFPDILFGWGKHIEKRRYNPEAMEKTRNKVKLLKEYYKNKGWLDRFILYVFDEAVHPAWLECRQRNCECINKAVDMLRSVAPEVPMFVSAWPFAEEALSSIDIWSMNLYTHLVPTIPTRQGRLLGKSVCLTLDGTYLLAMDRPGISARMASWGAWYADVPMMEYWDIFYWEKNPWDPSEDWFEYDLIPGAGSLVYPPLDKKEDEIVTSIRMENLREGMEDYEYLWLLRKGADYIRKNGLAGKEADLLRKADALLMKAYQMVDKGFPAHGKYAPYYAHLCRPPSSDIVPELTEIRQGIGTVLEKMYRQGYLTDIDSGHKPPNEWF